MVLPTASGSPHGCSRGSPRSRGVEAVAQGAAGSRATFARVVVDGEPGRQGPAGLARLNLNMTADEAQALHEMYYEARFREVDLRFYGFSSGDLAENDMQWKALADFCEAHTIGTDDA